MYLFYNVKTTGPVYLADRIVQFAWLLTDEEGNEIIRDDYLIQPDGWISIPTDATEIHGVTFEDCVRHGNPLDQVLRAFTEALSKAKFQVCHNVEFDSNMVNAEMQRCGLHASQEMLSSTKSICTMLYSTDYVQKRGNYGRFKWPRLQELHFKLFGKEFHSAHNAMVDVEATRKCFFKLIELQIIEPYAL